MTLQKATKQEYKRIKSLYRASFPRAERKPFARICRNCRKGKMEIWVIKENTTFLGFLICALCENLLLIDYFAVSPAHRGKGIGTKAIKFLSTIYPKHFIFLEIELKNPKAKNAMQRMRRKTFYLRCGFLETNLKWNLYGVPMEILCYQKQVSYDQCQRMYRFLYGRFWFLPIRRISYAHSQNSDIT